jgi:hypothetical protein
MAKAADKPTLTQLPLRDARARVVAVLGCSLQDAERLIVHWFFAGALGWGSRGIIGSIRVPKGMTQREAADAAQRDLFSDPDVVQINFDENSIWKSIDVGPMGAIGFKSIGVWVSAENLEARLSTTRRSESSRLVSKDWVADAVKHHPQQLREPDADYIRRLHGLQDKWTEKTIENRLREMRKQPR